MRILDNGGVEIEEDDDNVKITLAVDANKPHLVFDELNKMEIDLVKKAGNDLKKIENVSKFMDDLREKTKKMLEQAGLDMSKIS